MGSLSFVWFDLSTQAGSITRKTLWRPPLKTIG